MFNLISLLSLTCISISLHRVKGGSNDDFIMLYNTIDTVKFDATFAVSLKIAFHNLNVKLNTKTFMTVEL